MRVGVGVGGVQHISSIGPDASGYFLLAFTGATAEHRPEWFLLSMLGMLEDRVQLLRMPILATKKLCVSRNYRELRIYGESTVPSGPLIPNLELKDCDAVELPDSGKRDVESWEAKQGLRARRRLQDNIGGTRGQVEWNKQQAQRRRMSPELAAWR